MTRDLVTDLLFSVSPRCLAQHLATGRDHTPEEPARVSIQLSGAFGAAFPACQCDLVTQTLRLRWEVQGPRGGDIFGLDAMVGTAVPYKDDYGGLHISATRESHLGWTNQGSGGVDKESVDVYRCSRRNAHLGRSIRYSGGRAELEGIQPIHETGIGESRRRSILTMIGYIVAIDMTARNVQDEANKKGLPWSIAKGFDTFLPISNEIPRFPNPTTLFYDFILAKRSDRRVMTLEEGDIVLTGTAKGTDEVRAGDVMRATIEVDGREINQGRIEVEVQERDGRYEFKET
ncbi:hypothetical protein N7492_001911 [Penicillium capsulatum]|uniref:Fumarylacetoacetase-like C-terminal domain-containing protein n=1 Tax=Penicillium capsulatum TaxID=69766 RepID=A0A9W9IKF3_9EURO|nr:hypothetical protein N7492_001911 [Penicillium capsulatum]